MNKASPVIVLFVSLSLLLPVSRYLVMNLQHRHVKIVKQSKKKKKPAWNPSIFSAAAWRSGSVRLSRLRFAQSCKKTLVKAAKQTKPCVCTYRLHFFLRQVVHSFFSLLLGSCHTCTKKGHRCNEKNWTNTNKATCIYMHLNVASPELLLCIGSEWQRESRCKFSEFVQYLSALVTTQTFSLTRQDGCRHFSGVDPRHEGKLWQAPLHSASVLGPEALAAACCSEEGLPAEACCFSCSSSGMTRPPVKESIQVTHQYIIYNECKWMNMKWMNMKWSEYEVKWIWSEVNMKWSEYEMKWSE